MDAEVFLKVLVIHRDLGASHAYAAIARSAGWEAFSCEDIGDVVAAIQANDVDVLIFDFSTEIGFEALRKVRCVDTSLPAILITAHPVDHGGGDEFGDKADLSETAKPSGTPARSCRVGEQVPGIRFQSALRVFGARGGRQTPNEMNHSLCAT